MCRLCTHLQAALMIYGGKITMYILNEEAKDLLSTVKEFCEKEVKEQCGYEKYR